MSSWKKKEAFLNKHNILSRRQREMLEAVQRLNKLPHVDDVVLMKENHQMTREEFTAVHFISTMNPRLLNKTGAEIIDKVSAVTFKRNISDALYSCGKSYSEVIKVALKDKQEGIPVETLKSIQFVAEYLKLVKSYCRHFKLDF